MPNEADRETEHNNDQYDALFGRIALPAVSEKETNNEANKPGFWLRLAEDENYERLNLVATYIAVFFAPAAAFLELLSGPTTPVWSAEAAR